MGITFQHVPDEKPTPVGSFFYVLQGRVGAGIVDIKKLMIAPLFMPYLP